MKKHNMMRVASALAVVTLLSTSVISGTLAKYTSEATSQAESARVAKWAINAGSKNGTLQAISEAGSNSFTFDLFNTVKDTATAGGNESDISAIDGRIIAPGTWGYVDLVIENDSEVSAKYSIKLEKTSEDRVPLQYAMKKLDESAAAEDTAPTITSDPEDPTKVGWTSTAADVKIDEDDNRILNYKPSNTATATGNKVTYRVYWKWEYDTNTTASENSDTSLGVTAATGTAATPTVKATVTATQVD